jgi:hypothetical protein
LVRKDRRHLFVVVPPVLKYPVGTNHERMFRSVPGHGGEDWVRAVANVWHQHHVRLPSLSQNNIDILAELYICVIRMRKPYILFDKIKNLLCLKIKTVVRLPVIA